MFLTWIKRVYRLSLNISKQEDLLLKDLEKLFTIEKWRFSICKSEKTIEAYWENADGKMERFVYCIEDRNFKCRVKVLDNFPIELATEIFILATHFNNLIRRGIVQVNTNEGYVEYCIDREIFIPLLYNEEIYPQMMIHYSTSKEIFLGYQRLVEENEAPAIIIADLLKKYEEEENEEKEKDNNINNLES